MIGIYVKECVFDYFIMSVDVLEVVDILFE